MFLQYPGRSHLQLYLLLISLFFAVCRSAPATAHVGAQVAGKSLVGYVADPSGRGTSSLLISCVLTLILCVWSAVHLNVPPRLQSRREELWTYIRWILAGIYAPELVVFTAWRQWSSAKVLSGIIESSPEFSGTSKNGFNGKESWTLTHSFFACTGGFAIDCSPYIEGSPRSENDTCFLPNDTPQRMTITGRGIAFLARRGIVPDVPKADIEDKSKANHLAKTLVLIQALWMLLQVLGRVIARLPVTLLEVNTVAHVVCAFSMYGMWWHKPLTPHEPIVLRGEWVESLLGYMYLSSEISGKIDKKQLRSKTIVKTLFATLNLYSKTPEIELLCCRAQQQPNPGENTLTESSPAETPRSRSRTPPPSTDLEKGELRCTPVLDSCIKLLKAKRLEKESGTAFFERRPRVQAYKRADSTLRSTAIRHHLFTESINSYPEIVTEQLSFKHIDNDAECQHLRSEQLVTDYSRNWPGDDLLRDVGGLVVGMVLWLANLLYGGIHLAAWNDHFPSKFEKWMWRASASYIGFCGGFWVVLNYLVSSSPYLNDFWERWMDGEKTWFHNVSLGTLVFVCGFSLALARAYIVVEAFLSVRELPVEAYQTPTWAQIFPHF